MKPLKWIGLGLLSVAALCGFIAVALLVSAGPTTRALVSQAFLGPYPDGRHASWHTPSGEEIIRAGTVHFNIALQISHCFPGLDFSKGIDGLPGKAVIAFMLNMQPNGEERWGDNTGLGPDIVPTNLQRTVLTISRAATAERGELAASAAESRRTMLLYQWLIVIVGAMTTILVSIKAMSNATTDNRTYFVIGILAVVFSAVGTGLASINSFTGPSEAYIRAERGLLQARQLHQELELQAAQETDLCRDFDPDKTDDPRAKRLADFSGRLKELVASSGVGASVSSATSGAASTSSTTTSYSN